MKNATKTPVRVAFKWLSDTEYPEPTEVTALMPDEIELTAASGLQYITCYSHIGQHGIAHPDWLTQGKDASPEEYANLLTELESIGYEVEVI